MTRTRFGKGHSFIVGIVDYDFAFDTSLPGKPSFNKVTSIIPRLLTALAGTRSFSSPSTSSMSTSMGSLVGGVCLTLLPPPEDFELAPADKFAVSIPELLDSGVRGFWELDAFKVDDDFPLDWAGGFWLGLDFSGTGFPKKLMRLFCFMLLSLVFTFAGAIL
jgi:hypothetical protein